MAQLIFAGSQALQGGGVRYTFKDADANAVGAAVGAYFTQRGYSLEEGTPVNGTYGKGNAALRAVFGGFTTRFKFKFAITPDEGGTALNFGKGMSGMWGGALGATKMNREFETIKEELRAL